MFFSQQGEDVYILKKYINIQTDTGRFVEVGALDGISYSNTLFFEGCLGFTGMLIEPSKSFEKLKSARKGCILVNKAIANTAGTEVFWDDWALSGVYKDITDFREKINVHGNAEVYEVETTPLGPLLRENGMDYVDLLFIDVEGGELGVLESMDWSIPVYVICIELDTHNITKDYKCREILKKHGFEFDNRIGANEYWINKGYFRKDLLYDENSKEINWDECSELYELGKFMCIEKDIIKTVQDIILG
ncbi:hypothetical protein ATCVMN08101_777R [Acanthocystis turfacea Chlorella virus MN0810.1]|nr:hypothetical protein ATCVMN08101_777R [Acanthocystis turfacea Chlorella virus MN0810.1]